MRLPILFLTLSACASASSSGPGRLDPRFQTTAASAQGVYKAKVRVEADGAVTRLVVYHKDTERVPADIRALAESRFPGAQLVAYEYEIYPDAEVHEVEVITSDGKSCEVSATAAGQLRYTECRSDPATLAENFKSQVEKLVPGAQIIEVEEQTGEGFDSISVEAKAGDLVHYLRFKKDGTFEKRALRIPSEVEVPFGG